MLTDDPIVEEIRQIRERLLAEVGGDLSRYSERLRELSRAWQGRTVTKEELHADKAKREQNTK